LYNKHNKSLKSPTIIIINNNNNNNKDSFELQQIIDNKNNNQHVHNVTIKQCGQ